MNFNECAYFYIRVHRLKGYARLINNPLHRLWRVTTSYPDLLNHSSFSNKMMLRLKIYISCSNTALWHSGWFESRRWEGILRKKYFSSSTPSRVTKLILRIFPHLFKYKRTADMQTSQNTDNHARGERWGEAVPTSQN